MSHLTESDSRPLDFCPECTAKIWWTCRISNRKHRYATLARLARQNGLADDPALWEKLRDHFDGK